jgi:hypothetical protein
MAPAYRSELPMPQTLGLAKTPDALSETQNIGVSIRDFFLKILTYPRPMRYVLGMQMARRLFSYQQRLNAGVVERQHYGFCIFQAARLAALLDYPRISVIEFGCGGGNGLVDAEMHIAEVTKIFPVQIDLYGFDLGSGLPTPQDYRDIPHYFEPGFYQMDRETLEKKLKFTKLVIGDVRDTCQEFFDKYNPAPVACIFHDLDFYSSTQEAFKLFDMGASHFLPRVFMYFDDIIGDDIWLCNEFTGEGLAIAEFNRANEKKKIAKNVHLQFQYPFARWAHQIYIYHDFEHPKYNQFVAHDPQRGHARGIRLK